MVLPDRMLAKKKWSKKSVVQTKIKKGQKVKGQIKRKVVDNLNIGSTPRDKNFIVHMIWVYYKNQGFPFPFSFLECMITFFLCHIRLTWMRPGELRR